ncbi:MAG: hypothetical protein A2X83_08840 [Desulfuromonadales bacterium GWD2_54_10]|nr:MAG: hypothetical protein A2X83_08840 [Desulfuromonadales bacterium GWD2_54_10]
MCQDERRLNQLKIIMFFYGRVFGFAGLPICCAVFAPDWVMGNYYWQEVKFMIRNKKITAIFRGGELIFVGDFR